MNEQRRFILGKEPYIRKADRKEYGTDVMMRDLLIALIPLIIFAWVKNGIMPFINGDTESVISIFYPIIFIVMGGLTTWLIEYLYYRFLIKVEKPLIKVKDSFAIIPGVLLAMILPLGTPLWLLVLGCIVATVIGKLLFGGFGYNIFNPALVGYIFINFAYFGVIKNGFANPSEIEIMAGATPLKIFSTYGITSMDILVKPYGNLWNFFLGTVPGVLAETSALLCIISCIYLIVRKVISWHIPVIYIGSVFILVYIIGAFNGYATDLSFAFYHVFSGGLMFGAVFMATEPVTNPKTPGAKVVFALCLGVLTVFLRFKGQLAEGVATAILTMNLFTIIIDRSFAKVRVADSWKNKVMPYAIVTTFILVISIYTLVTVKPSVILDESSYEKVEFDDGYHYKYLFYIGGYEVEVIIDSDKQILSIDKERFNNDEYKRKFIRQINKTTLKGDDYE